MGHSFLTFWYYFLFMFAIFCAFCSPWIFRLTTRCVSLHNTTLICVCTYSYGNKADRTLKSMQRNVLAGVTLKTRTQVRFLFVFIWFVYFFRHSYCCCYFTRRYTACLLLLLFYTQVFDFMNNKCELALFVLQQPERQHEYAIVNVNANANFTTALFSRCTVWNCENGCFSKRRVTRKRMHYLIYVCAKRCQAVIVVVLFIILL